MPLNKQPNTDPTEATMRSEARNEQTTINNMVAEALRTYELAAAEVLRTQRDIAATHDRDAAALAESQSAEWDHLLAEQEEEVRAATESAARVSAIAEAAADVKKSAADLLEKCALGYLAGISKDKNGVQTFTGAPNEQAARSFAEAELAAIDLRQHLLELAMAYADAAEWDGAFRILVEVCNASDGPVHQVAATQLRDIALRLARAALARNDAQRAYDDVTSALKHCRGDAQLQSALAAACASQAREALIRGERQRAADLLATCRSLSAKSGRTISSPEFGSLVWFAGPSLSASLGGHSRQVLELAFRDNATLVSTDGRDVKVWGISADLSGSELARTFDKMATTLSASGRRAGCADTGMAWDVESPIETAQLEAANLDAVTDGGLVVSVERAHTNVRFVRKSVSYGYEGKYTWINWESEQLPPRLLMESHLARNAGDWTNRHVAWPAESGEEPRGQSEYADVSLNVVVAVKVVEVESGAVLYTLPASVETTLLGTATIGSGWLVAAAFPDGKVTVLDSKLRKAIHNFHIGPKWEAWAPPLVTFSRGGGMLLGSLRTHNLSRVAWWRLSSGGLMHAVDVNGLITATALSADDSVIALGFHSGNIEIRDSTSGSVLYHESAGAEISAAAFSPDSTRLAVGNVSGQITILG